MLNLQANFFKDRVRYVLYRNVRARLFLRGQNRTSLTSFSWRSTGVPHLLHALSCPQLAHFPFSPRGSTVSGRQRSRTEWPSRKTTDAHGSRVSRPICALLPIFSVYAGAARSIAARHSLCVAEA